MPLDDTEFREDTKLGRVLVSLGPPTRLPTRVFLFFLNMRREANTVSCAIVISGIKTPARIISRRMRSLKTKIASKVKVLATKQKYTTLR